MNLKDWRIEHKLSQEDLAVALSTYALKKFPKAAKAIKQRTLAYWEKDVLPRKFWLNVIAEYTKNKVTPNDFIDSITS